MHASGQSLPIVPRLAALLEAGFEIDRSALRNQKDVLWLRHCSWGRTDQRCILLYDTGLVVGAASKERTEAPRFGPDEVEAFQNYLKQIPRPRWWESFWGRNSEYHGLIASQVAFYGFCALLALAWKAT